MDNIKMAYDYNISQGEFQDEIILWETGKEGTLTITPVDTYALYVAKINFFISDDFTFGASDEINLTINAYDNSPAREITAASLEEIMAHGDPQTYFNNVFPTWGKTHMISWMFRPPIYLKSSTSPSETVVLNYVELGGISVGHCLAIVKLYNVLESESGLS
jgi:hypothetical protein